MSRPRGQRPGPLSGFPELLPAERAVETHFLDTARRIFELHGFASIETRAVEPVSEMLRKGEIDKEVYVLRRLHAEPDEADAGLGLHFDLTVPLARYVVQNAGHLDFPFRRFQIQKVWRGERPQVGRYREFTQADIDIVGRDSLAFHHEVEVAVVMAELLRALPIPPTVIRVNNRKLAEGFFRGAGARDVPAALRAIDKLAKVGPEKAKFALETEAGLSPAGADACLALATIRSVDESFVEKVIRLGVVDPLLDEGLAELHSLMSAAAPALPGAIEADLGIARGLDYYTGTVYETEMLGHVDVGSICSGGRYDTLAVDGRSAYPGVGISLGVSRLLGVLLARGLVRASRSVPTCVLVAVTDEEHRLRSVAVAAQLRARGIPTEVAPSAAKFGKQIKHADRRGIPFVWFPEVSEGAPRGSIKDLRSGAQAPADPSTWAPEPADLYPRIDCGPFDEERS